MKKPRVLLFDLGGVVVRWTGVGELSKLAGLSRDAVLEKFSTSKTFSDYEVGLCDDDMFTTEMLSIFDFDMSPNTFKRLWCEWVGAVYHDLELILPVLRDNYVTACLSNTNHMHWEHLKSYLDFDACFDHSFASHQINLAKPDLAAYRHVSDVLDTAPEDIHFFDDTQVNIEAAEECGIRATLIDPNEGVATALFEHGYMDRDFYYIRNV